jgi:tRNA threonylcarbamoyl adenosine modification protein YeaZ
MIGLLLPSGEIKEHIFTAGKQGGKDFLPLCKSFLETYFLKVSDLKGVVVGTGPGSFTGIRLAVAVAQAFSQACKLPIYPISSLYFFNPGSIGSFAVLHDARRGNAYVCTGTLSRKGKITWNDPSVEVIENIAMQESFPQFWVSPHFKLISEWLPEMSKVQGMSIDPQVAHLLPLIEKMRSESQFLSAPPIPQSYLRGVVLPKQSPST